MKRPNLQVMDIEEGVKLKTKGIGNLLNRIIAETSLTWRKRELPW
jgi:hypothetical protein